MRKKAEVQKAEQGSFDLLWYVRHKTLDMPAGTPDDIVQKANAKAAQIESQTDAEYLEALLRHDVEYGMLVGRLAALRWVLGMGWTDDGILDT